MIGCRLGRLSPTQVHAIQVVVRAGYEGGLLGWEVAVALRELGAGVSDISEREGVEALELGGGGADLCEWTPGQDS